MHGITIVYEKFFFFFDAMLQAESRVILFEHIGQFFFIIFLPLTYSINSYQLMTYDQPGRMHYYLHPPSYSSLLCLSPWLDIPIYELVTLIENFEGQKMTPSCLQQRRQWQSTPVLLPGKSHGRRSLVGCSPWGCKESDTTERLHFDFSLSCIGRKWQPTPVFLPGESQGEGSLVGCRLRGCTELDTTEATQQQQQPPVEKEQLQTRWHVQTLLPHVL